METTEKQPEKAELHDKPNSVAPYDLLFITRAYNRKEITFEQWLKLTKEWAERMIQQYGKT